jgi:hypothetical protein
MNWLTLRFAKISAGAGVVALIFCLGLVVYDEFRGGYVDPTDKECETALWAGQPPEASAKAKLGELEVGKAGPTLTTINRHICISVSGVVSEASEVARRNEADRLKILSDQARKAHTAAVGTDKEPAEWQKLQTAEKNYLAAEAAASTEPAPVDLNVFINGRVNADLKVKAYARTKPQILRVLLAAPADATASGAIFWRDVLSGGTKAGHWLKSIGQKSVVVGLSRSAATVPEANAQDAITLVVYRPVPFVLGIVAFFLFVIWFVGLARHTTLLRDNPRLKSDTGPAEAEAQAAAIARTAAVAEKAAADQALAAVNSADAAARQAAELRVEGAAKALQDAEAAAARASVTLQEARTAAATAPAEPDGPYSLARTQMAFWMFLTLAGFVFIWLAIGQYYQLVTEGILVLLGISATTGLAAVSLNSDKDKESRTGGFFADIFNDGDGPKVHRIQAIAWTVLLGVIFVWNVFWNFTFVNFDTKLLLLMGVVSGMYLGFKWKEPAK